ncbi:DUF3426 domain-containing protein [Microbulbifer hydrolyticus]|uniref:DUF3426 domain-containing protein n=1 Tax=Microbulbifer hydrolyticus TaxID=48074 RepID=A0A6P1TDX7_9GAMM|nr:DUF3426 domain-containing protein [Microbulbifer hydrolyticus]MBB5212955.1 putative Zn finger-like uncharacterized protein [Microbulbifer hydrolyticus]QHQ40928.1 DUF3426 domain-containing protein [Microbulbifer hydrolyticus]
MSQLVTRCPHCSTSFHVSEQQLRAARGAVRCGSCLQVFRADENIVFNEGDPTPAATKKAIDELLEDDDFLIHDDIELDGDDEDTPPQRSSKPASGPAKGEPPKAAERPRQNPLIDDAFGEQQWQDLDDQEDAQQDLDLSGELDSQLPPASEDPWAEEIAREESSGVIPADHSVESLEQPGHSEDSFFADEQIVPTREGPGSMRNQGHLADDDAPGDAIPAADDHIDPRQRDQAPLLPRDQLISAIGPAPIEVNWQPRRHNRVPAWLWTLGVVLLMLALAAQTAYFRFDTLSKRDPWRGIYAQLCPLLDCKLPAQVDISAVHTSNLVVRSHPQIPGALAVEAVLLNRAPFDQPFPTLQLRFTDLKNAPVASRRFTPQDYLKGELSGKRLMPAGNPVHIALDIIDPGPEAVNYELRIAP